MGENSGEFLDREPQVRYLPISMGDGMIGAEITEFTEGRPQDWNSVTFLFCKSKSHPEGVILFSGSPGTHDDTISHDELADTGRDLGLISDRTEPLWGGRFFTHNPRNKFSDYEHADSYGRPNLEAYSTFRDELLTLTKLGYPKPTLA
jgi:hypothetical protein